MVQHGVTVGLKLPSLVDRSIAPPRGGLLPAVTPKARESSLRILRVENGIQAKVRSWYGLPIGRPQSGAPRVVQRVAATVHAGFGRLDNVATDVDWAGGGRGTSEASDHAERKAWRAAKEAVKAKASHAGHLGEELSVQIEVTKGICHHCQIWFELVLLPLLQAWDGAYNRTTATKLYVEVKLKNRKAVVRQVTRGMDWSGISYSTPISDLTKEQKKTIRGEVWADSA